MSKNVKKWRSIAWGEEQTPLDSDAKVQPEAIFWDFFVIFRGRQNTLIALEIGGGRSPRGFKSFTGFLKFNFSPGTMLRFEIYLRTLAGAAMNKISVLFLKVPRYTLKPLPRQACVSLLVLGPSPSLAGLC